MANVIAVAGIRRLIDQIGDEMRQQANKAHDDVSVHAEGYLEVDGEFAYDKQGNLTLVGKVIVEVDEIPAEAELEPAIGYESGGNGAGRVKLGYKITMDRVAME